MKRIARALLRLTFGIIAAAGAAAGAFAQGGEAPPVAQFDVTPPGLIPSERFGSAVALARDGLTALVGAPRGLCSVPGFSFPCGTVYAFRRSTVGWEAPERLNPAALPFEAGFGISVALSADGSVALIGTTHASRCTRPASDCGSALVFRRSDAGWVQEAELFASAAVVRAGFGHRVALSDDGRTALISAPGEFCGGGLSCGTVYVFRENGGTWTEVDRLLVSSRDSDETVGFGLALSGDGRRAFFGAPGGDCPGGIFSCGKVYVFAENGGTWELQTEILPAVAMPLGTWGSSLAADSSGRVLVVGAGFQPCASGRECGAAAVFQESGGAWSQVSRLDPGTAADDGDRIGFSVGLSADGMEALVGAPGWPCDSGDGCGAVFLFRRQAGEWRLMPPLTAIQPLAGGQFGQAVALAPDARSAWVGEPERPCADGLPEQPCGAASRFEFEPLAVIAVPTAGETALGLLILGLAAAGVFLLRGRT